MKRLGLISFAAYVATIWLANWAITRYGFVSVGFGLIAPAGVYFAGLAFTLRDTTQATLGKAAVVAAIILGALLSYSLGGGTIPGGHVSIAAASGIAFLFSEFCDFAIYTPIARRYWLGAVVASNLVGAVVDSLLFLWLAFGSVAFWKGQVVGKWEMTALAVLVVWCARLVWARREAVAA